MAKKPKTAADQNADTAPDVDFEGIMAKIASGQDLTEDEAQAYADHEARQAAIANGTHPTSEE